jgi:hypothetical protein
LLGSVETGPPHHDHRIIAVFLTDGNANIDIGYSITMAQVAAYRK